MATQCKCTALELNHSVGGNCAENVLIARACLLRPLRLNKRDSRDAFSATENITILGEGWGISYPSDARALAMARAERGSEATRSKLKTIIIITQCGGKFN